MKTKQNIKRIEFSNNKNKFFESSRKLWKINRDININWAIKMASIHKNAIRMDVLHTYRVTEFSFFSSDTKQKIEHRYRSIRHSILMLIYFPAELVFSNVSYSLLSVVGYYWLKHHTCVCFNASNDWMEEMKISNTFIQNGNNCCLLYHPIWHHL